ncbi:DNA polymerase delta subunit 4 [Polyodon spathula]|uniref:DNA polymerase delta subunit 4 n=1 Tax=Polyodon spathula TaxID=7913 RepID=UPI001B7EE3A4|nr:DNA polymerase delta subunit 4 [Polyodon spathula]
MDREMPAKRKLITDSFKVVNKVKKENSKCNVQEQERDAEILAAPPLSQRDSEMQLLREFDLNWEFGPCTGITRLQRWHRADKLGLKPPAELKDVIINNTGDSEYLNW